MTSRITLDRTRAAIDRCAADFHKPADTTGLRLLLTVAAIEEAANAIVAELRRGAK
jgi:hypothetical protein